MREPNVIGDWQEYDQDRAGLRVRVHGLEKAEPPRGREEAAEGLTYFRFRVTVENRGPAAVGVHLEDGQLDVRTGTDGESALLDWRNSQFIEGYDVYPLRRATAVLYAAAADTSLHRVDIQVHVRMDEEWTDRHLWSADLTLPAGVTETAAARADAGAADLAGQVSNYLRREAERGQG
ncbi:hypothetical protein [Streptomyces griseoaurantiacus]|uniref:hypothetical protein n=1 Tax=Streptomyces griseoaurantiacus TaxID=68213 RepID=UPI003461415A